SLDARVATLSGEVLKPLARAWLGRLGVFVQHLSDESPFDADFHVHQVNLAADHTFAVAGWNGVVSPGLLLRYADGSGRESDDWQPTTALRALRDRHSFGVNSGYLVQDRRRTASTDVTTQTFAFDYRYSPARNV